MELRLIYELMSNNVSNKSQLLALIGFLWAFVLLYKHIYTKLDKQNENMSVFVNQQLCELYAPLDSLFLEALKGNAAVLTDIKKLVGSKKYLALEKDQENIDRFLVDPQNDKMLITLGDGVRSSYNRLLEVQEELGQSYRKCFNEIRLAVRSFIIVFTQTLNSLILTIGYCYLIVSIGVMVTPGTSWKVRITSLLWIVGLIGLSVLLSKIETVLEWLGEKIRHKRFEKKIKRFGI